MEDKIRVVSVDPGVNLGVAVIDYYLETKKFKVLDAYTLDLSKYIPNSDEEDKRDISLRRLAKLKLFLKNYIKLWQPDIGAHETAYVPHRGGGASIYSFASLIENILVIKFSFIESSHDFRILEVNPTLVKTTIVGIKSSDKTLVLKALKENKDIDLSDIEVDKLNQHNADAIAIGVTGILVNLNVITRHGSTFISFRRKPNGKRGK